MSTRDLEALKALLKAEEDRVDALSDEELASAEAALSQRVRDLSAGSGGSSAKADASRADADQNWRKIQERMGTPAAERDSLESEVLPFVKKGRALPWTTIGIMAAAAIALLVIYPRFQSGPGVADGSYPMQTKGTVAASGGFCDVDLRGRTPEAVEEAASGNGFDVYPGEGFQMSFLCDQSGYVQIWSDGTPAAEFRNIRVNANERTGILVEGKEMDFTLNGKQNLNFGAVLTREPISNDIDLLESSIPATGLGSATILWSDSIHVRGRPQ